MLFHLKKWLKVVLVGLSCLPTIKRTNLTTFALQNSASISTQDQSAIKLHVHLALSNNLQNKRQCLHVHIVQFQNSESVVMIKLPHSLQFVASKPFQSSTKLFKYTISKSATVASLAAETSDSELRNISILVLSMIVILVFTEWTSMLF